MLLGFAVAIMGAIMKFVLDLWSISWLIDFGGMVIMVIGVIVAILGLIGLVMGGRNGRRHSHL